MVAKTPPTRAMPERSGTAYRAASEGPKTASAARIGAMSPMRSVKRSGATSGKSNAVRKYHEGS